MTDHSADDEVGSADGVDHRTREPNNLPDDLLARLVTQLADAVILADGEGRITFWNDAATRLFGWSTAEALGETLDLIIPERLRERHWTGYRGVMATGHTSYGTKLLEVPALHRDGSNLSIAFTVTLLFDGEDSQPSAIAAVLRDDTERWQERRRLRDELARLRDTPQKAEQGGT
jgi:PAS domain S-box-containing protein